MESTIRFLGQHWQSLLPPFAVAVITVLIGLLVRNAAFRVLRQWAGKDKASHEVALFDALRNPALIWILMLAIHFGAESSSLPARAQDEIARVLLVLFIVSMTLAFSRLAGILIRLQAGAASYTSLTENLARIVVVLVGVMIVLNTLGISVLPILTAFGVGGIAIALALQDTLSNLFGGFYVSLAGQVKLGDYIKLDSGEEGYIVDVSWRSTSVRSIQNNVIIIPNAKLAKATVTNYDLPERAMAVNIAVSVGYESDIDFVERMLLEEVRGAMGQVTGLLGEPAPVVRFDPGFGSSSLDLSVICFVQRFADQSLVKHELRKRFLKRLRRERIEIPFPTRTIHIESSAVSGSREEKVRNQSPSKH